MTVDELARDLLAMAEALDVGPVTLRLKKFARSIGERLHGIPFIDDDARAVVADWMFTIGHRCAGSCEPTDNWPEGAVALRSLAARLTVVGDGPELLTEAEAIRYLRLDREGGPQDGYQVLWRYRRQGLLRAAQVGREVLYPRKELERFIHLKTEGNR